MEYATEGKECCSVYTTREQKTGKGRRVVAPIKKRVDRIIASYKRVGNPLQPNDYLFMNPAREDNALSDRTILLV